MRSMEADVGEGVRMWGHLVCVSVGILVASPAGCADGRYFLPDGR